MCYYIGIKLEVSSEYAKFSNYKKLIKNNIPKGNKSDIKLIECDNCIIFVKLKFNFETKLCKNHGKKSIKSLKEN